MLHLSLSLLALSICLSPWVLFKSYTFHMCCLYSPLLLSISLYHLLPLPLLRCHVFLVALSVVPSLFLSWLAVYFGSFVCLTFRSWRVFSLSLSWPTRPRFPDFLISVRSAHSLTHSLPHSLTTLFLLTLPALVYLSSKAVPITRAKDLRVALFPLLIMQMWAILRSSYQIGAAAATCRCLSNVAREQSLWHALYVRDFVSRPATRSLCAEVLGNRHSSRQPWSQRYM